jgi:homoserine dehydrogenase
LAGAGTVGGGVIELLALNREWIKRRIGRDIEIKAVLELEQNRPKVEKMAPSARFVSDMQAFVQDPEIECVVELIGGTRAAKTLLVSALEAGKHVVTANKALLAEHGQEIFPLAAAKKLHLGFEASVAGGIPLVQTLKETLAANRVQKVMGILNGTANFILTEMSVKGMEFGVALKMAQEKGFAEADPTLDIEGMDAAHKLTLLIQLAFGVYYPYEKLPVTGISVVTPMDICLAREFGYQIKLIGQAQLVNGKIEAGVFPALIPSCDMLASVQGSFNAVMLEGNAGPIMLHGYGAGALPTASAVLADIIAVAVGRDANNTGFVDEKLPDADILDLDAFVSHHYLRLTVPDRPGVLRDVGGIMAKRGISLAQVVQKGDDAGHGAPIVFLTHKASAADVHAAMRDIDASGLPLAKTMHYRIL